MSYIIRIHDSISMSESSIFTDGLEISRHDLLERRTQGDICGYDSDGIPFCEYSLTLPVLIGDYDRAYMLVVEDTNRLFDGYLPRRSHHIFDHHALNFQSIIPLRESLLRLDHINKWSCLQSISSQGLP